MTSGDPGAQVLKEVMAAQTDGPALALATVIEAPQGSDVSVGAKMLVRRDGTSLGSLGGGALENAVRADVEDVFRRHAVETFSYSPDGARLSRGETKGVDVYRVMIEVHEPPATLLVIGGGHIGKALATIGDLCGFYVVVVDDRPEYADPERFPEADRVLCGRFEEVLRQLPIDGNTYIVTVTRGHRQDETALRVVAESSAAYVGMIGSRRRVGAVLQHLVDEGLDAEAVGRVHTPIGLDIGAETPEEIAVSIMAEVIMIRRGGAGRSMRDVKPVRRGIAPAERLPEQEGE